MGDLVIYISALTSEKSFGINLEQFIHCNDVGEG